MIESEVSHGGRRVERRKRFVNALRAYPARHTSNEKKRAGDLGASRAGSASELIAVARVAERDQPVTLHAQQEAQRVAAGHRRKVEHFFDGGAAIKP